MLRYPYTACLVELTSCNDQTITSSAVVSLQYGLSFTRYNDVIKSFQVLPNFINILIAFAPNQLNGRQQFLSQSSKCVYF